MVAYAPTEEVTEGEKAKYMLALKGTVKPVPAREHVFVLTDANAKTEKKGEEDGETDSKVLGLWPRRAQGKRQTATPFRRRQQTCSSDHLLVTVVNEGTSRLSLGITVDTPNL